jgi:Cu/Ag efflux pump CusA
MSQTYLRHFAFVVLALTLLFASDHRNDAVARPTEELAGKHFPIVQVIATHPGASPEEVERQVTIPLEVTLAGIKGPESVSSKSQFGRSEVSVRFKRGTDLPAARQEIINRLQFIQQLPNGVSPSVASLPSCESLRYILKAPHDASGKSIYSMHDLRTLQDWVLEREFRRIAGVFDVASSGGAVRRYEIQVDLDRLKRYGVTFDHIQTAFGNLNLNVRNVGLFPNPFEKVRALKDPDAKAAKELEAAEREKKPEVGQLREAQRRRLAVSAAKILADEDSKRIREIRNTVIATVNNDAVRIEDIVVGGRVGPDKPLGAQGVIIGIVTPSANVVQRSGSAEDQVVQGVVFRRRDEDPSDVAGVLARIKELNASIDKLLPGVQIEPYFARDESAEAKFWIYGFPASELKPATAREILATMHKNLCDFPEVHRVVSQVGGADAENEPIQLCVGLKPAKDAPERKPFRRQSELNKEIGDTLRRELPIIEWLVTAKDPMELEQAFPGIVAEHLIKIVGPDLAELDRLAVPVKNALRDVAGIDDVSVVRLKGLPAGFTVDAGKCKKWGVKPADVYSLVDLALHGKELSSVIEGGMIIPLVLCLPKAKDGNLALLDLPFDITNHKIDLEKKEDLTNPIKSSPRIRLRDLVSVPDKVVEPGAAAIYREQGKRILPIRFRLKDRPMADVRRDAVKKIEPLLKSPYRIEVD